MQFVLLDGGALEKRTTTHHMGAMSAEDWTSLECRESRDTRVGSEQTHCKSVSRQLLYHQAALPLEPETDCRLCW